MKKNLLPLWLLLILICVTPVCYSQSLTNWTHYYAAPLGNFNMLNNISSAGPEEIIQLDKTTLAYTRIPFPADIRQINLHNSGYLLGGLYYYCLPYVLQGPGLSLFLKGCSGNNYLFDGISFSPFSNYLGTPVDSLSFLSYTGGSVFFTSQDNKLHKYDGTIHSIFDLSNSPYSNSVYYYVNSTQNDDIFMVGSYNIAIYHGGSWTTYDTAFFNHPYMNTQGISTSPSNDYSFFNGYDSTLYTFVNSSSTWASAHLPSFVIHASSGLYIASSMYDASGDLWLTGDSLFCRYDGTSFYDYFGSVASSGINLSYLNLTGTLAGNKLLFSDYYHNYIFDAGTLSTTQCDDSHAVLSGNQLLPSLKDNNGNLWFGSCSDMVENGLMKYDGTWSTPIISNYLYGGVFTIKQDTGQAIVFGGGSMISDGPVVLSDTSISILDPTYSFNKAVEDIAIDQIHHYWYGGTGAGATQGLAEFDGTGVTFHLNPTSSNDLYSIDIDSLDNKWISYTSWDGVYKYNSSGWTNYTAASSSLPNDTVFKIIRQPNTNNMWFCTSNGFAQLANGIWTIYNTSNSPLPSNIAEYIYFADDGSTWFATQNGFASLYGSTWEVYTTANSQLHNSDIESIVLDNDCNVWIATENGLSVVRNQCASSQGMNISGTVYHSGSITATNTLIYIYKLNSAGTDVNQVENVYTDNTGKFYYTAVDTGTYFFDAFVNQNFFPGEINSYHDSAIVIQQSNPLHVVSDGNFTTNIWLKKTVSTSGSCVFKGKLVSSTERIGSVPVILMYGGQPVTSVLSNMDGTFTFNNIAALNYSLWIDKYGLNNTLAPSIMVNCANGAITYPFTLYPDHLVSVNDISGEINDHFNVFPNPFSEKFTINIVNSFAKNGKLLVIDISGKILFEKDLKLQSGENQINIDGSAFAQGIYFIQLRTEDKIFSDKIVK